MNRRVSRIKIPAIQGAATIRSYPPRFYVHYSRWFGFFRIRLDYCDGSLFFSISELTVRLNVAVTLASILFRLFSQTTVNSMVRHTDYYRRITHVATVKKLEPIYRIVYDTVKG